MPPRRCAAMLGLLVLLPVAGCQQADETRHDPQSPGPSSAASTGGPAPGPEYEVRVGLPACPDGPLYSVATMRDEDYYGIRALGFHSVPIWMLGAKHSSWAINLPGENRTGIPIVFPSAATVPSISRTTTTQPGKGTTITGHGIDFYPCRDVRNFLGHLGPVSERLTAAFDGATPTCQTQDHGLGQTTSCRAHVKVEVEAGEPAGTNDGSGGVDFGMIDYRRAPHAFANLSRYSFDHGYYASPLDHYESPLREELLARVGSYDGTMRRTDEPLAGTFVHDVAGTLQGNWFPPGKDLFNTEDHSPFLSFAREYVDSDVPLLALGNSVAGITSPVLLSFTPEPTGAVNRPFRDVTPGGVYCYDHWTTGRSPGQLPLGRVDAILLVAMPNETTLQVERQETANASCSSLAPWSLTASAATFER